MMPVYTPVSLIFLFLCGHALADFALQTEWVATNKNRNIRNTYTPAQRNELQIIWPYLMSAHCLHHALIVFLLTQNLWLGIAEFVVHFLTDFAKCEKYFGFHADQFIHITSKFVWAAIYFSL